MSLGVHKHAFTENSALTFAIDLQQIRPLKSLLEQKGQIRFKTQISAWDVKCKVKLKNYLKAEEVVREVSVVYDGRVEALQWMEDIMF